VFHTTDPENRRGAAIVANASADKLKELALRHGEKAVMTITALLCLFFLYTAVSQETIDLTADQVKGSADQAQQNINRKQEPNDILKVLVDQGGIKVDPGFEKAVEQQKSNLLLADNFRPAQLWTAPEPGAGLIRDQPELIAPSELYAYPGRGGALVFELDDAGNRIPDPEAAKPLDQITEQRRSRRSGGLGAGGARRKMDVARKKAEDEKKRELEIAKKKSALAGVGELKKEEAVTETPGIEPRMKEKTVGIRWVAITGVLKYKQLRDTYLSALKRPEVAYPHFKQLDVERQVKQSDGSWSEWEAIDQSRNMQILDNLPEEDEEWTPDTVRISALVSPLPYLKAGFWERVHVAKMVPAEKLKVAEAPIGGSGGMPGMPLDVPPTVQSAPPPMSQPADMPMATSGGMAMSGGVPGGGMGETIDFEKRDVEEIMIRALDLTVEPDTTYRFRLRIVVYNPNLGHEDVSAGVDSKAVELFGPWSDPTDEVTMPPDVATYALARELAVPRKLDQVKFEVARWAPESGVTVVKPFSAAPGEIIGELARVQVPITDETGKKLPRLTPVDFNSHQVVLDVMGGNQPIPPLGPGTAGQLTVPALALVVRRDGAVVIRSQVNDIHDQVRKDMADNFVRELKAAEEEKKKKDRPGATGSTGSMP
jgi:hypothetical protein